jgi:hypothetical protein
MLFLLDGGNRGRHGGRRESDELCLALALLKACSQGPTIRQNPGPIYLAKLLALAEP